MIRRLTLLLILLTLAWHPTRAMARVALPVRSPIRGSTQKAFPYSLVYRAQLQRMVTLEPALPAAPIVERPVISPPLLPDRLDERPPLAPTGADLRHLFMSLLQ
jgi:hypothetical protein